MKEKTVKYCYILEEKHIDRESFFSFHINQSPPPESEAEKVVYIRRVDTRRKNAVLKAMKKAREFADENRIPHVYNLSIK